MPYAKIKLSADVVSAAVEQHCELPLVIDNGTEIMSALNRVLIATELSHISDQDYEFDIWATEAYEQRDSDNNAIDGEYIVQISTYGQHRDFKPDVRKKLQIEFDAVVRKLLQILGL